LPSKLKGDGDAFKTVYFDFNKSILLPNSSGELNNLVSYLKEHPDAKIEIAGHGDNIGSWEVNLLLSDERAKSVYNFLREKNIPANRMLY
ncbi:OmpA family protein, partial [Lacticaseibacillus paracasei]